MKLCSSPLLLCSTPGGREAGTSAGKGRQTLAHGCRSQEVLGQPWAYSTQNGTTTAHRPNSHLTGPRETWQTRSSWHLPTELLPVSKASQLTHWQKPKGSPECWLQVQNFALENWLQSR